MPYHVKVQEVQVADLTRQLTAMPNTEKTVAERDATIAALRKDNAELKQRTIELSKENVFSDGDPYPKAFRRVRLGDPFSKIDETYPGRVTKGDPDDTYVSAKVDDFFFSQITYYYDPDAKPRRVIHILFHLNRDPPATTPGTETNAIIRFPLDSSMLVGVLKAQLTQQFGTGKAEKRATTWNAKGVLITLKESGSLSIDKR